MSTITKLVPIPSGINQGIKPADHAVAHRKPQGDLHQ